MSAAFGHSGGAIDECVARIRLTVDDVDIAIGHLRRVRIPTSATLAAANVNVGALQMAEGQADAARVRLEGVAADLAIFERDTMLAGTAYEWAESAATRVVEAVSDVVAYAVGKAARVALVGAAASAIALSPAAIAVGILVLPVAVTVAMLVATKGPAVAAMLSGAAARAGIPLDRVIASTTAWAEDRLAELLADPRFQDALALALDSADEAVEGLLGLPMGTIERILASAPEGSGFDDGGDGATQRLMLSGVALLASLTGETSLARLRKPAVAVPIALVVADGQKPIGVRIEPRSEPVTTLQGGFDQLQSQEAPIVIEQFVDADGTARYQVYMQGTQAWTIGTTDEGLDMLSNLQNAAYAGGDAEGSAAALLDAMEQAGIPPDASVDFFGHSQAGAAMAIAASTGTFTVGNVVTYGAPAGHVQVAEGTRWIAVQNAQDPVAHGGGTYDSSNAIVMEVDVPAEHIAGGTVIDGHLAEAYMYSTGELDASGDPVVEGLRDDLGAGPRGPSAQTWAFEVRREQ